MLTLLQCKEILDEPTLSDEEVIEIRDLLFSVTEQFFDAYEFAEGADISSGTRHDESVGTPSNEK